MSILHEKASEWIYKNRILEIKFHPAFMKVWAGQDDGNSFTKEAGAPLPFATLSFAPLPFAQNQRKVAEGSENAPKG